MFIEMASGKIISGAAAGLLASNIEGSRETRERLVTSDKSAYQK